MATSGKKPQAQKNTDEKKPEAKKEEEEAEEYVAPEVPKIKLNNDREIPVIGLSTVKLKNKCKESIIEALKFGYRHIDCAEVNGNEKDIGEAIKEQIKKGQLKREQLYVTSKLWNTHHAANLVRRACESSLKNLGLKYLDCYVMHSPMGFKEGDDIYPKDESDKIIFSDVDFLDTWKAMEKLVQNGLVMSIGLANFNVRQISLILDKARIKPALLHVECHPYMNQQILLDYCAANEILVIANNIFGCPSSIYRMYNKPPLFYNPKIVDIAQKAKHTPAQVLIQYQLQRGNVVVATATNRTQMKDNILSVNCKLSSQAIEEIDAMDTGTRVQLFNECKGHPHHPYEKDLC